MNPERTPSTGSLMLALGFGTLVGAVLVALTTPKTGPELRGDLKDIGQRARRRVWDLVGGIQPAWDGMTERRAAHVAREESFNGQRS